FPVSARQGREAQGRPSCDVQPSRGDRRPVVPASRQSRHVLQSAFGTADLQAVSQGPRSRPMTAETDLLPLPEYFRRDLSHMTWEGLSQAAINYASANVASAVAPLQAEIEALRAEVERVNSWNERVSVCRDHVTDIVDGPCVICALDAAKARADKLEDALRDLEVCANTVDYCYCRRP